MKLSDYFRYKGEICNETKPQRGVLKTLYRKVKKPWLLLILGAFFAVFNSIVILTQYENYMAIFTGALSDLSPLWQYLGASFIQYILIFGSRKRPTGCCPESPPTRSMRQSLSLRSSRSSRSCCISFP